MSVVIKTTTTIIMIKMKFMLKLITTLDCKLFSQKAKF